MTGFHDDWPDGDEGTALDLFKALGTVACGVSCLMALAGMALYAACTVFAWAFGL